MGIPHWGGTRSGRPAWPGLARDLRKGLYVRRGQGAMGQHVAMRSVQEGGCALEQWSYSKAQADGVPPVHGALQHTHACMHAWHGDGAGVCPSPRRNGRSQVAVISPANIAARAPLPALPLALQNRVPFFPGTHRPPASTVWPWEVPPWHRDGVQCGDNAWQWGNRAIARCCIGRCAFWKADLELQDSELRAGGNKLLAAT